MAVRKFDDIKIEKEKKNIKVKLTKEEKKIKKEEKKQTSGRTYSYSIYFRCINMLIACDNCIRQGYAWYWKRRHNAPYRGSGG